MRLAFNGRLLTRNHAPPIRQRSRCLRVAIFSVALSWNGAVAVPSLSPGAHPAITPGPLSGPVRGRGRFLRGGPGYGLSRRLFWRSGVAGRLLRPYNLDYELGAPVNRRIRRKAR